MTPASYRPIVLVTGATGYVGGRLLGALARRVGERVRLRAMARHPEPLRSRFGESVERVAGDVFDPASLDRALAGVEAAYYLIHSMGSRQGFAEADRKAADHFGAAARRAGCQRIIYLGGLGDPEHELSPHLRSRHETGERLHAAGVEVIELRASIVLGSGSLSFELIRALVERLPVMVTPSWVSVRAQPIAIEDLLDYLVQALRLPPDRDTASADTVAASAGLEGDAGPTPSSRTDGNAPSHRIFEIGGADSVSYADLMREYARQRGLRRLMVPVPFLTPRLSSLWLGLVTPVYARIGRTLIDGVRNPTVVRDERASRDFSIRPRGMREAIARALANEDQAFAETRWSDALSVASPRPDWGGVRLGSRLVDSRAVEVPVAPAVAFAPIRRIGGANGWYHANLLWRVRGFLDLLVGGVGLRRGRRDPEQLEVGEVLDFWRVEAIEPDRRLRLAAEMKVPGRAWLEFEVGEQSNRTTIRQTAIFDPKGLAGLAYWYGLYPAHRWVFSGMLRGVARRAVEHGATPREPKDNPS